MKKRAKLEIALVAYGLGTALALAQNAKPVEKFNDWTAYVYSVQNKKICFAVSQPKDMLPKNVIRGKVIFYISNWPQDGVKNEISIKIGYPLKPGSTPTAQIGNEKFNMFTKDDKAFIAKAEDERRLIEAMKRGSVMVVKGLSQRGTLTTDKYSLAGLTAAIERINKDCS